MSTELKTEESMGMEEAMSIDNVTKIAEAEQACVKGMQTMNVMQKNKDRLLSHFGDDFLSESLEDRVAQFKTLEELGDYLSTPENINSFFTDENGTVTFVSSDGENPVTEEQDLEFKKGFLIYIRQMQMTQEEIDRVMEEFHSETAKMNDAMNSTMRDFVGDYMEYIISMKKEIENSENYPNKEAALKELEYIESGLTFSEILKMYVSKPSIIESTLRNTKQEDELYCVGRQYKSAIKKARTNASLITFLTETPQTSFEALYLPKEMYREGYEGLFIYSLIRFFAKSYWSANVKKMHTSIIIILQRFIKDEMDDATRDEYIKNIGNYLDTFYKELDKKGV